MYGLRTLVVVLVTVLGRQVTCQGHEQPYYSYQRGGDDGGYMADWANDWDQSLQQQKCIDIPQNMTLCKDIGYTQMRIPNLLDHDTVREVTQQAGSWVPLLGIRCHPDTKLFLCSLFSPVCLDRPIWPCRTLCEAVKNGCEALMLKYGFPWPEMLRCDKFPPDNDLCIGLQHDNKPDDSVCEVCNKPETYEAIVDNFCSADFVYRVEIDNHVVSGVDLKITTARKKKRVKKGDVNKRDLRNMVLYIRGGSNCDCRHLSEEEQSMVRNGGKRTTNTYLAMGSRQGDKLVLQYFIPNTKANKDLKRAWKSMRRGDVCENGMRKLHQGDGRGRLRRPGTGHSTNDAPLSTKPRNSNNNKRDNDGKKKRKKCKNPKKCAVVEDKGNKRGKNRGDRGDRRTPRGRRQKGSRDHLSYLFS